jgi:phage terminase large subunit
MTETIRKFDDLFQPTERQKEAWLATFSHRYILYGGARGGGKSKMLRWWLVDFLIYQYMERKLKDVRVMLACETYRDLADRQLTKIRTEFPSWLGRLKETKEDGLCFFLSKDLGGGIIALRNLDEPEKYQSAEFAAIGVDELTKNPINVFNILRGSLRWVGIPHTVFLGATNPGGVGHGWVKSMWIDHKFPIEMREKAKEFAFIQSLPVDNPYLESTYWDELNSLPEDLRKAWVEGNWEVFAGQAFPAFSAEIHVIQPITIPSHFTKWRCIDWGFANPWCCLWLAKDPDNGRIYVYREAYARQLTDRQQATLIKDMTPEEDNIVYTYADPSMWSKKSVQGIITSSADEYGETGVMLTRGDNDRLSGKRKLDRLLENLPDGKPGIYIFSTCPNLAKCIPYLAYDKIRIEDVDTNQEDHPYDALRYGLTSVLSTLLGSYRKRIALSPFVGAKGF